MSSPKSSLLWIVNVVLFVLVCILACTGFINWFVLPGGGGWRASQWFLLRHFFKEVHEISALLFLVAIAIHVALHWPYVRANLKRMGRPRQL